MGWFDQFTKKEPDDLGSFNYQTEQEQLKRRRALAQQLYQDGATPLKGQMVPGGPNGFYVAPGRGEQLAQLAKSLLGAYMTYDGSGDQKDLDKKSMEALAYNMENKPWEKRAAEALKTSEPVQPTPPDENGIQTFAVPDQAPNTARTLAADPRVDRPNSPDIRPAAVKALAGEQPQPQAITEKQLGPAPVPLTPPVSTGRPVPDPTAQPAPQPAPQPQGPTSAEQIAYLQRIANSGPAGQAIAQQMMAKPQLQHVQVKNDDGSESVIAFDPSGRMAPQLVYRPQPGTGPSSKQLARDEFAVKAYDKLTDAQKQLSDSQTVVNKIQNARELLAKYAPQGGVLSTIRAGIGKMLGEDQSNELDMVLKELALSDLKNVFGGNPTEGERQALAEIKASVGRGTAPSLNALNIMLGGYERNMRLHQNSISQWQGVYDQYRSQPPQKQGGRSLGPAFEAQFPPKN